MISGMRKDILVAGFLLSIIDRYKGNILVVCPNSFFTISGYTGVVIKKLYIDFTDFTFYNVS